MENLEHICFEIIAASGQAKSEYLHAVELAKDKEYTHAEQALEEGDRFYNDAHQIHMELLSTSVTGEQIGTGLLLMHAEDLLSAAEVIRVMAEQIIDLYKELRK